MTENESKQAVGCGLAVFSLCVTTPMWLVLVFALMQANNMPTWAWVLYWCYVPANVFGVLFAGVARYMMETK